jgi:hypothetical protein
VDRFRERCWETVHFFTACNGKETGEYIQKTGRKFSIKNEQNVNILEKAEKTKKKLLFGEKNSCKRTWISVK